MNRNRCLVIVLILFTLIAIRTCTYEPSTAELVGTYVANHDDGADTLIVKSNNTYFHKYVSPKGVKSEHKGIWEAKNTSNELRISFHDYYDRGWLKPNFWSSYTEKTLIGEIRIIIFDDAGEYFIRVASSTGK